MSFWFKTNYVVFPLIYAGKL